MQRTAMAELAEAVAALMDTTDTSWHTEPTRAWQNAVFIVSDHGHEIALIPQGRSITARGFLPREPNIRFGPSSPDITMTARSAQYIHRHISRRLMPRYEAALTEWRRLAAETLTEQAGRASVAAQIAYALGAHRITPDWAADVHVTEQAGHVQRTTVRRGNDVRADVGKNGATVDLTVKDLTGDQAAAVCELVHRLTA